MTWQLLIEGGPYALILGIAWAVWKGHLVLGRELEDAKQDNSDLQAKLTTATETLATMQAEERTQMMATIEDLRAEITALKTGGSA